MPNFTYSQVNIKVLEQASISIIRMLFFLLRSLQLSSLLMYSRKRKVCEFKYLSRSPASFRADDALTPSATMSYIPYVTVNNNRKP
jgi:hypothetical protein